MWEFLPPRVRLRGSPCPGDDYAKLLLRDWERFRLPRPLEPYVLDTYGIDLTSAYGGARIKNPFGKASGQLSLATHQVDKDAEAGLGFVVLKTVIAQDERGEQTMREWAIPETRMLTEPIVGRGGAGGWTVTWKGRGWFDTFEAYCKLLDEALAIGQRNDMLVAPSVKYHLPTPQENFWKEEEYNFTTRALLETWSRQGRGETMPLEKDFSPTLAGSERASQQAKIMEWLKTVPRLIHAAAPGKVSVGLKIFNTLFEDDFQLRMLQAVHVPPSGADRADFLIYGNRLFDPSKQFEGKVGVAYGGPDLSDRNLAILERFLQETDAAGTQQPLPTSATGDIGSGRTATEYLLRGASSFQMHTLFQLPDSEFALRGGNKTEKALHLLLFHPSEGFLAWVLDLGARFAWGSNFSVGQMAAWCRNHWPQVVESGLQHDRTAGP